MFAKKINKLKNWIIFSLDVMWAFKEQLLFINERNPYYPQLYHWVLSFLPEKVKNWNAR